MSQSSSRVKLNRDGPRLVPRRRRVSTSPNTVDCQKQEETRHVCEIMSVKDTVGVPSSNEPGQSLLSDQMRPGKVTHTASDMAGGEPEETGVDNRNAQTGPTGLAGTEGSLRRAVGSSRGAFCGDCKYISLQQKTLGKRGQKRIRPGLEQSRVEFRETQKKQNPDTEPSKKIVIWIDQYPKVTLCDIAQYCDICSHKCVFVLPEILETKNVRCFKKDITAGFRFGPACLADKKHRSEECTLAKNRVQSEKRVSQSQSLSDHQRKMKERSDSQTMSSHTAGNCFKGWTTEAFLEGKCTNKGKCRTSIGDKDVEEDPGPGENTHRDKRARLRGSINGFVPSIPDLKSINCNETAKPGSVEKEKTYSWMSDNSCSSLGSTVTENFVCDKRGQIGEPRKTDAAQMSSELLCHTGEVDADVSDSFTCQRVRPYFRKNNFSCARTYKPWPFSNSGCTLRAHAGTTVCPAEITPLNQSATSSSQSNDMHLNAPSDSTHQISHQSEEKQEENAESCLAERNSNSHGNMSSCSSDSRNLMEAEESVPSRLSDIALLSPPSQHGRAPATTTVSASSTPVSGPETNSSIPTPSPSVCGLSDWETATTLSSSFTHGGLSSLSATPSSLPPLVLLKKVKGVDLTSPHCARASPPSPKCMLKTLEKTLIHSEGTQMASRSSTLLHNSDSFHSCQSSLIVPQETQESDKDNLSDRSPPKLEQYFNTNPRNSEQNIPEQHCVETNSNEFTLLPLLSPVTSPRHLQTSSLPQYQEEMNKDLNKYKMLPEQQMSQIDNGSQNIKKYPDHQQHGEHTNKESHGISTSSSVRDVNDYNEEESQDGTHYKDDVEQGNRSSNQVLFYPEINKTLTSGVLTEPHSSPTSDEDDDRDVNDEGQLPHFARKEGSGPSETAGHGRDIAEAVNNIQSNVLDECTAYEQDILLVNVIQNDPELFENLPEQSLLKLGPTRLSEAPKTRPAGVMKTLSQRIDGVSLEFERRLTPINVDFLCNSPDITEERGSRPWRPQYSSIACKAPNTRLITDKQCKNMSQPHANNNCVSGGLKRVQPIQTVSAPQNIPPVTIIRNGPRITTPANMAEIRHLKSNAYCRQYFSESVTCGFRMCWFHHVPLDGDEKFCVETVIRFTKNPMCLQKAGAVFTGYYNNNPPGVYFSMSVLLSLLWSLLKAGMVSDVLSVLSVSLAHKIVPSHEFLLALFKFVREKCLMGFVPELRQLTFKMVGAGLVQNLDCLDSVKNTLEFQHTVHSASPASVLSTSAPVPEYLNLAHSIVEIELCTKQGNWRQLGEVFRSVCQFSQHPKQVERISRRIAIALLSERKDKLSLPFAAFAETLYQNEGEDGLISQTFLGRIGVSLMLRYHKTHQWAKGRRVVEVLFMSKVNYSTLKGLFENEDGASRCFLVTVAAELFLLSGSVAGALNTLRENNWFLSSSLWPCEPADPESRSRVLMRLAEKTSHRDTLEVLCNLPGIKEPNDTIDVSRYCRLFNSHLQVCADRQILPVASDTVDFMLSKNLAVDPGVLQTVLQKLGKQNLWRRAREVFRRSLSVGYYTGVSAPSGFMSLIVPCRLGEVELALTFEMLITVNATAILQLSECSTTSLSITLKRTQSCESEYLSAGSRLLSAANIPQPKLTVHFTSVNALQEQVFTLDISSARQWLCLNHLWANEVWQQ